MIPARLRKRFGIKRGTLVTFIEEDGRMIVQPVTLEFIRGLRGSLKGEPSALEVLLGEHKRERTQLITDINNECLASAAFASSSSTLSAPARSSKNAMRALASRVIEY